MIGYHITPAAEDDLDDIFHWIAADNREAALELMADIKRGCEQVAQFPEIGSCRPQWTSDPVRFLIVRSHYIVAYMPDSNPVEIVRIIHTSRDIPALLAAADK